MTFVPLIVGRKLILATFQLACFCLAGYMAYVQFQDYFSNQDLSYVSYKTFVDDKEDVFPTFSVCLYGVEGNILDQSKLPKRHSSTDYSKILRGESLNRRNFSLIQFHDVSANLQNFVTDFYTTTDEGEMIIK